MADERGLATAGQTHDAENFARLDGHGCVSDTNHTAMLFQHGFLGNAGGLNVFEGDIGFFTEDFPDAFDFDGEFGLRR